MFSISYSKFPKKKQELKPILGEGIERLGECADRLGEVGYFWIFLKKVFKKSIVTLEKNLFYEISSLRFMFFIVDLHKCRFRPKDKEEKI